MSQDEDRARHAEELLGVARRGIPDVFAGDTAGSTA